MSFSCVSIGTHLSRTISSLSTLSLVRKLGSTTISQSANIRVWNGNTWHPLSMKSSNFNQPWEKLCTHHCQHRDQSLSITSLNWQSGVNVDDNCQKVLCCCMTMPILILLLTLLKHCSSYTLEILEHPPHRPCCIRSFQIPQRCFKRLFCQWPWVKGGNSYIACRPIENIFSDGICKLVQYWTKCIE
jgi:hypothetical protein